MKKSLFRSLRTIDMDSKHVLNIGDCFLEGETIIEQKVTKEVGDFITYYKVTDIKNGVISYTPTYDKLEDN
jgi:hypothetical protein